MSVFTNSASRSSDQASAYTAAVLELLGENDPIHVLENTVPAIRRVLEGLSKEQVAQREAPGKWSVRHVLQHLADSELVGGYRFRMVLAQDRPQLAGYDQDLWAQRLGYDEADAEQALRHFSALREGNLRLFARASADDLKRVALHAERGEESVGLMMRLYAGHDLLHLRQIDRIRRAVAP